MSVVDTLRDALRAAYSASHGSRVYGLNEVPPSPTYPYAVLSLAPGAPDVRDLGGSGARVGRFTVQHFGKSDDSVEAIADLAFATFDGKPLPLPGAPVAWLEVAATPYRDPDDQGVLNVLHTYRY